MATFQEGPQDTYRLAPDLEAQIRRIVREEIAKAFGMLAREASHQDGYDTDTIRSYALSAITDAAGGAASRVTCKHETYESWNSHNPARTCRRCGEPEPEIENPFEEKTNG